MASVLPLRSCVVLIGQLGRGRDADRARRAGESRNGDRRRPLVSNAMAGPLPVPISIESEAKACCSLASPVNEVISSSILFLAKKPRSTPSSMTDIGKETCTALPTRSLSAARAGLAAHKDTARIAAKTHTHTSLREGPKGRRSNPGLRDRSGLPRFARNDMTFLPCAFDKWAPDRAAPRLVRGVTIRRGLIVTASPGEIAASASARPSASRAGCQGRHRIA